MIYPLFVDMQTKLENDLDLKDETFIQPTEMQGYFNEAIAMIQHQIHTLCEDYFLSDATVPVTAGQTEIQLPSNIYSNKLRKVIWNLSPEQIYELTPIKDLMELPWVNENDPYRFLMVNNGVTNQNPIGTVLRIYPKIRTTDVSATAFTMWYIRNANTYVDSTSICDIPEWSNVIIQYVRYKCHSKEMHPNTESSKRDLDILITNMIEALRSRDMTENTRLALDPRTLAEYSDFTSNFWNYW